MAKKKNSLSLKYLTLVFCLSILLSACDQFLVNLPNTYFDKAVDPYFNYFTSQYMKNKLIEGCTEVDLECINAVESQFDSCHHKYHKEWARYMNSSSRNEDSILQNYSIELYNCITDKDGIPFFEYNSDNESVENL